MTAIEFTFVMLLAYQVKQFLADFPLQREYMLKKSIPGWGFFLPMLTHCGIHALLTLIIVLMVNPQLWYLAAVDFVIHFAMDRVKSGPRYLGRFKDKAKSAYWNVFGFDQMVHHLTHIYIVWVIVHNTHLS